uniref:Uncharacterized protein MANES_01G261600 n=1 Tax=Rhizophora mucronata TaxID=61149 RepID=A0A2P2NH13_RHIMU
MRNVSVPRQFPTLRPPEWHLVAVGSRNSTFQTLILSRAVSLSVYQPIPVKFQGPLGVLARSVLGVFGVTGGKVDDTRHRRRWLGNVVVGRKVKRGVVDWCGADYHHGAGRQGGGQGGNGNMATEVLV